MSLLKKFAGETVIYGLGSILPRVLNFAMTFILTWILGQGEFGQHGNMYALTAFMLVFFTYGMETALFRFGSKEGQLEKVFSTAAISLFVTTIIFITVLWPFTDRIAAFLEQPEDGRFIQWFILITAFDALSSLPFAKLRLENRPIRFALIKILSVIFNIAMVLFFLVVCPFLIENGMVWFGEIYDDNKKLDYIFLANLAASGGVLLILFRKFFNVKWQFDSQLWLQMITYALPLIVVGFAGVINRQLDRIFLTKLLPVNALEQTGVYNASVKIAVLMSLFITAFNYAAEPFFFKNADRKDAKPIYAQIAQAFSVVGSIVFLGIMLYIDLIQYSLGKDFRSGLHIVPIMLLAYFWLGIFYNFSIWYKLTDRTRIGAYISVGGALVTIIVNFIFIPKIGIIAPAYAALTCYIFMATTSYFIGKKYYPIDYPIGKMLTYIFVAVGVFYLSEFIRPYLGGNIFKILFVNTLLFFGYLGGFYLLEKPLFPKGERFDES